MAIVDNQFCELNHIDHGITDFIQEINNLGYKTIMSCSGMKKDHYELEKCPFICIDRPEASKEEIFSYLCFIGDCFYNSNFFVEFFSRYIIGYLPWGLDDSNIEKRFQKFVNNLKNWDFFNNSY
jgi:hypothetical protein